MSLTLTIISLLLSILAVATSTFLLVRQTIFMRHANEIPVSIELHQEFRSEEFQRAYIFVLNSLAPTYSPSLGLSNLPTEVRVQSTKVAAFFTSLGGLVSLGLVDERYAVALMGTLANRAWAVLGPYILCERQLRSDDEVLAFFEDFVCRVRENHPLAKAYGINFKRIPDPVNGQPLPVTPPSLE